MSNLEKITLSFPSYENYIEEAYVESIAKLKSNEAMLDETDAKLLGYLEHHYSVIKNTLQTYQPSNEIVTLIKSVPQALDVYILLENWCGSSAANVPYIVKILQTLTSAHIHIVPRDSNPDFMDLYLTDGKRSIPKVIGFIGDKEVFNWGSMTKMQAVYATSLKEKNLPMPDFIREMQAWFRIHNAEAIEQDFLDIFK
jgi:hypothetical protein